MFNDIMKNIQDEIRNLSKLQKNQIEITELKNTISEI